MHFRNSRKRSGAAHTHNVDEPKIANRGGRRMQQQNEVTCTQMACVSVQIECLGCRFFDAVQTHQVDVKDKPKINVRSPKCATRKQNTHRSRTCPHGWDEIMGHTLRSSFSLQPFPLVCDVRVCCCSVGWENLQTKLPAKWIFVSVTQRNDTFRVHSLVPLWPSKANKNWQFVEINSWWLNQNV